MNSTTPLYNNSTSNDLTFTDIILNPFLYGSIIIIIILISCIITFIFILKSKKELLVFHSSL